MSRPFRFALDEHYHVYNRGTEKRKIFMDERDAERFLSLLYLCNSTEPAHLQYQGSTLKEALSIKRPRRLVAIGAYCLMHNHFHLLLREIQDSGVSRFMQKLMTAYTMYFNIRHERSGTLFQGKFKARHVDSDNYLQFLYAYIHLNPIEMVEPHWKKTGVRNTRRCLKFLESYQFSSYPDFLKKSERGNILDIPAFPAVFSTRREFSAMMRSWLSYRFLFDLDDERKGNVANRPRTASSRSNLDVAAMRA
jgi:putative transposase